MLTRKPGYSKKRCFEEFDFSDKVFELRSLDYFITHLNVKLKSALFAFFFSVSFYF